MLDRDDLLLRLPTLSQLMEESYVFTRAHAPSHWTVPSHASLFTGTAPSEHMAYPPNMKLRADLPTLSELFQREGYLTALVSCNPWIISDKYGLARGFETAWAPSLGHSSTLLSDFVIDLFRRRSREDSRFGQMLSGMAEQAVALLRSSPRLDNGGRAALRYVQRFVAASREATFLVVNLMEAHDPYYARGPFSRWASRVQHTGIFGPNRLQELTFAIMGGRLSMTKGTRQNLEDIYWENVVYLDSILGKLLGALPNRIRDEGFLVVLSDHGQMLGDKGDLAHVAGLSQELIRVPLLIRPPGGIRAQYMKHPVDITWLFHLLKSIAMGDPEALPSWLSWSSNEDLVVSEAHGNMVPSVFGLKRKSAQERSDLLSFKARRDRPAIACISARWKLICHLGMQKDKLYDVLEDPKEVTNLGQSETGVLQELHEQLRERFLRQGVPRSPIRTDNLPLDGKEAVSQIVLTKALHPKRSPVIVWTGGKDSTLVLYLCIEAARREGRPVPPVMIVDHNQHFPETWSFIEEVTEREALKMTVARNENLFKVSEGGATESVQFESLDPENQEEALKAGQNGPEVSLSLDDPVANHLLKTLAMNRALTERGFDTVIAGIRWDENPARSSEVFFSQREDPRHTRVHPILPWTEREVWSYTLENRLPIHPLYVQGYRSFDGVRDSKPTGSRPAWEQDLEESAERAGRAQDKEAIMERLRELGYF